MKQFVRCINQISLFALINSVAFCAANNADAGHPVFILMLVL